MPELTPDGRLRIEEVARRHGTSFDAALTLLQALIAGGGTMAQFSHPDLGGMGQWSQGGMTMVGDMFNNALKAKVDGLCAELAGLLAGQPIWQQRQGGLQSQSQQQGGPGGSGEVSLFVQAPRGGSANWWGTDLGDASSTGAQNSIRYAYFPGSRRLAIEIGGKVTIYDTGDHRIGGVSQQQSGDASLTFMSQHGLVRVGDLPIVLTDAVERIPEAATSPTLAGGPIQATVEVSGQTAPSIPLGADRSQDILLLIERLAALREKMILSEEEFAAKKAELLSRL